MTQNLSFRLNKTVNNETFALLKHKVSFHAINTLKILWKSFLHYLLSMTQTVRQGRSCDPKKALPPHFHKYGCKCRFYLVNPKHTMQPAQSNSWTNNFYEPVLFSETSLGFILICMRMNLWTISTKMILLLLYGRSIVPVHVSNQNYRWQKTAWGKSPALKSLH